ncbi:MAG: type II toxin-antitoxin system death-on-curing family toxin [Bacteroidota bacterium]|nr:type II toxin-antitoxin system death-on-curing family toxin [Bacteroidota bacterium]
MAIKFIPEEIVLTIHSILLERYGGSPGIRDKNLLESALAQPKITMAGKYLHKTIFDKAAAYGFHVCKNHPFVDGNKRVSLVLMDIFLQKNGWQLIADETSAYEMMMNLASGKMNKAQLSNWLEANCKRLKL